MDKHAALVVMLVSVLAGFFGGLMVHRIAIRIIVFFFPVILTLSGNEWGWAAAQTLPSPDEQQRIERQQEQLLRRDDEKREEAERQRKLRELTPPEPSDDDDSDFGDFDGQCVDVRTIRLDGFHDIDPAPYRSQTKRFEGRCLTIKDIQGLLSVLNEAFREAGFVTTRAYLAPQEMADGLLIITIVEGKIEDLSLNSDSVRDRSQLYFAFPTGEGEVLDLRDVEQGLDQMNRLASNNARMQIQPGTAPGTSIIAVQNDVGDRFRVELGRENSGTTSTGKLQDVASFSADNVLGFNDGWLLNYNRNARDHDDDRRSESVSGVVSIPFGYTLATYSGSYYRYNSLVEGLTQDFLTSGVSTSHKFELSQILHRDDVSKTRFDVGLTAKRTRNFIEEVLVEISSRKLAVANIALAHSARAFGGVASLQIGHERGLRILGALDDSSDQPNEEPNAQFRKWTLDASFYRSVSVGDQGFTWRSSTRWQYSPDTLFGSERIGVGGQYSVRGFRDESIAGDIGGYWRNELAWRVPDLDWGVLNAVVGRVEPFTAFDWGWIKKDRREERENGVVSGWTIGVRNHAKRATLDVAYSKALAAPSYLSKPDHEIYLRAVIRF